jgi:hypothetical protein
MKTTTELKQLAFDILETCREEFPDDFEEAVMDSCHAAVESEGLTQKEASVLRGHCGF